MKPAARPRNTPALEAAFLRAEGRFAVMVGAIAMAAGLALALVFTALSFGGAVSSWTPALAACGPVILGWAGLTYGAWRFEQAHAVIRGKRPRKLYLAASVRGAVRQLRRKDTRP